MSHVSILLHVNRAEPFSANSYQMGRLVSHITEQNNLPATHARVTGAERPQTVSHLETPIMCSALWPRPNHHLFPSSQIPDMPLQFSPPWHSATGAVSMSSVGSPPPTPFSCCSSARFSSLNKSVPQAIKDCDAFYG